MAGYYNNKRYKKRRNGMRFVKNVGTVANTAIKALTLAKKLKKLINVEFKEHNVQATTSAFSTTPTITQISNIDQGDTRLTRDGDQIKVTSIYFRCIVGMNASAARTSIRIMIIKDKQTNSAIYAIGDLLEDTTANDALVSPINLDNRSRFTILMDKQLNMSDNSVQLVKIQWFKKQQQKIIYDGSGNGIADLTSGSYSLVLISSEATNTPTITLFTRLRFIDN